uniref:Uncharacterized protein n=1 Tax=Ralstonia solanacearum TaxID=305 RepID=A0A0S4VQ08_RALSL|nr:protein of unknown function [Ralstonia solanacearum]
MRWFAAGQFESAGLALSMTVVDRKAGIVGEAHLRASLHGQCSPTSSSRPIRNRGSQYIPSFPHSEHRTAPLAPKRNQESGHFSGAAC